ncbi:unnamed protein product [Auanema sp. JU1783]|nr:unnamed protein product [Auanema sp. JU1783]
MIFILFILNFINSIDSERYGSEDLCPDLTVPLKTSSGNPSLCYADSDCPDGYKCTTTTLTHFEKVLKYCCQTRESICSLPPNPGYGDCFNQPKIRYFFDTTELKCKAFKNLECLGGNQNKFDSVQECTKFCQSTACNAGETLLLSPSNNPVICASSNVCPDGHRCVYDQLFRRHVCCGMTRQDVCPHSTLSFAASPSFKPLKCEHSTIGDACPQDFVCTGSTKAGFCCTPQYGQCSLGQSPYIHPITKRSMKCDPLRLVSECPLEYHCSSAVPGAYWGFCCSNKITAQCPEGSTPFLDQMKREPVKCTVGVTVCSIGYTCQSTNRNIIGFCCSKNLKHRFAHAPAVTEFYGKIIDGGQSSKEKSDYHKKDVDDLKSELKMNTGKNMKFITSYSAMLNNLKCPASSRIVFYEGTQLVRECTPVPGLNNLCPSEAECVAADGDVHRRSVCCILTPTTTFKPRISVTTPKVTRSFIYMVTAKTIPFKMERSSDPFCPTVISRKSCKLGRKTNDCPEAGFFCQYNIELREFKCCSMEYNEIQVFLFPCLISFLTALPSTVFIGIMKVQPSMSRSNSIPSRTNSFREEKEEKPTPWISIYSCGICSFIQAAQFTVYFSSMWPYLLQLDPKTTESMYGWAITFYSLAQCISAPSFGYWSNRIEQVRIPIMVGFSCMIFGNILYLTLDALPSHLAIYGMIIARFATGAGTGNATLLRTYVGSASTTADRFRAIACVSAGLTVGTMIGPAFQLLFTPLGEKGFDLVLFRVNMFTGPAILSLVLNLVGFILMKFFFEEHIPDYAAVAEENGGKIRPDMIAIGTCVFTRFTQIFVQTTVETINSPYSILMFGFSKSESVKYNSLVHGIAGFSGASLFFFFIITNYGKSMNHRLTSLLLQFLFVIMFFFTFSWPFLPESVPVKLPGFDFGCDAERFTWCDTLKATNPWLYYGCYIVIFGIAFSILNVSTTTLYSEIIGPKKQGTLQGVYQMAGSVGRLVAPLAMSGLYSLNGPNSVWIAVIIESLFTAFIWIIFYGRMVAYKPKIEATNA